MPFGVKPQCAICKTTTSTYFRKNESNEVLCNSCGLRSNTSTEAKSLASCHFTLRKSTRAKSSKFKQQQQFKTNPKGKGRRIIFKRSATKAPTAVSTPVTTECAYYKGTYYQIGDIVSMSDAEGGEYFAQIRGLLQDQYCEKSAVIAWLIPSQSSPKDYFDPSTYMLGPEEDIPRKLEAMEFVCHAPSEYYKAKYSPYQSVMEKSDSCFIWTRIGPQIKPVPTQEEVFGTTISNLN